MWIDNCIYIYNHSSAVLFPSWLVSQSLLHCIHFDEAGWDGFPMGGRPWEEHHVAVMVILNHSSAVLFPSWLVSQAVWLKHSLLHCIHLPHHLQRSSCFIKAYQTEKGTCAACNCLALSKNEVKARAKAKLICLLCSEIRLRYTKASDSCTYISITLKLNHLPLRRVYSASSLTCKCQVAPPDLKLPKSKGRRFPTCVVGSFSAASRCRNLVRSVWPEKGHKESFSDKSL